MNASTTRRAWLAALAAAGGAAALPNVARAAETKFAPVRIAVVATDVSAEPIYAEASGAFRRAGVSAQIQTVSSGGAIISAIAGNALDVGFANLTSVAAARQRGIPIIIVAPSCLYTDKSPITVLMKARGSKLRTGADLSGKTIAVSTLRGELQVGAAAWIDKTGGDSKNVKFVEMPCASMAPALKGGRIDAAMLTEPAMTIHKDDIELLSDAYTAIAPEFLIGAFVASDAWVKVNTELAHRFSAAIVETAKWANGHRAETAPVLAEHAKLEAGIIRSMVRATYGERLSPELIQPVLDTAYKYGSLKAPMKTAELIAGGF